jgi:hypothetical protein
LKLYNYYRNNKINPSKKLMGLFYYSITILAFYKMPKQGAQQQSPNDTVRRIVDLFLTQYIAQMIAGTLTGAEFLKHLAGSLDSIVRFHVDKIHKLDFAKLLNPLLNSFSQLTDADFLHSVVILLNEQLVPKGFVFSLSDVDGKLRMTVAVTGKQSVVHSFASAVCGGGSAASVVSSSPAARSFAAAVGGGGNTASAADSLTGCLIQMNPLHPFFRTRGNEVPAFLQNLVQSQTLSLSIRFWLLASSFFEHIFRTFPKDVLSQFGILCRTTSFYSPFTTFFSAMFEGDSTFRNVNKEMLLKTQRDIVAASEHIAVILRVIYQVLDQPGQPILSEEAFTMFLNRLRGVQKIVKDDKNPLQFRFQVVASLFGLYLIQIIESADHKKRVQDVLQFKTFEAIEQACNGDLERNFESCVNTSFFKCSETGCNINPITLLVANTHPEPATRAKALKELRTFYETIAMKKKEKMDGLEKEAELRSSMSRLAVGGGCAAEAQSDDCIVCMDAKKTHAFQPCGHHCVCANCAYKCQICPMCREPVIGSLKIFGC